MTSGPVSLQLEQITMAAWTQTAREEQPLAWSHCLSPWCFHSPRAGVRAAGQVRASGLGYVSMFFGANTMQLHLFTRHLLVYPLLTPQSRVVLDTAFALHQRQDLSWGNAVEFLSLTLAAGLSSVDSQCWVTDHLLLIAASSSLPSALTPAPTLCP